MSIRDDRSESTEPRVYRMAETWRVKLVDDDGNEEHVIIDRDGIMRPAQEPS